jgi:exodeoxyribonuclease-5
MGGGSGKRLKVGEVTLAKQQMRVVETVMERVRANAKITVYDGPGGTGKSVVAAAICGELTRAGFNPVPCTMVGKAAARLQDKLDKAGLKLKTRTLSSLCERVFMTDDGPRFTGKDSGLPDNSVLFVDEMSMVGARYLTTRLLPAVEGLPIVGCGDAFQIPPVMDKSSGLLENTPLKLTQVHRQARESPILALASAMREDKVYFYTPDDEDDHRLLHGSHVREFDSNPGVTFIPAIEWLPTLLSAYPTHRIPDIPVLVGTNEEVAAINDAVRRRYRLDTMLPMPDEIIRCLRNNSAAGVYNGEHYRVERVVSMADDGESIVVELSGVAERVTLPLDPSHARWSNVGDAVTWGWGYATTIHRSQGSEWDHVRLVVGPHTAANSTSQVGRRLLYTGITRAAKQLDVYVVDYDYARKVAKLRNRLRTRIRARLRRESEPPTPRSPTRNSPRKRTTRPKKQGRIDLKDLLK